jgi:NAD(P)-dependent dehydrogenase (short-subunit alcohol dehydrogenase family)
MNVFITGVSSGVGRELARLLVRQGHHVTGIARREPLLRELSRELPSDRFRAFVCDTRNLADVVRTSSEIETGGGLPDAVVLNAAIAAEDVVPEYSAQTMQDVIATNLVGPLAWVGAFISRFQARQSGQFIAVSSLFAYRPDPTGVSYAASKAGLTMAFRSLRVHSGDHPVAFKVIHFGPIDTDINPRFARTRAARGRYVLSPLDAASAIEALMRSRATTRFAPAVLGHAFRACAWIPDRLFQRLTSAFRR